MTAPVVPVLVDRRLLEALTSAAGGSHDLYFHRKGGGVYRKLIQRPANAPIYPDEQVFLFPQGSESRQATVKDFIRAGEDAVFYQDIKTHVIFVRPARMFEDPSRFLPIETLLHGEPTVPEQDPLDAKLDQTLALLDRIEMHKDVELKRLCDGLHALQDWAVRERDAAWAAEKVATDAGDIPGPLEWTHRKGAALLQVVGWISRILNPDALRITRRPLEPPGGQE